VKGWGGSIESVDGLSVSKVWPVLDIFLVIFGLNMKRERCKRGKN